MIPLTKKQKALLEYLRSCEDCPSFVEMKDALGLKSKSGVHRLVDALEERGYIRRMPNRARAIEVVPHPQFQARDTSVRFYPHPDVVLIPFRGRIS